MAETVLIDGNNLLYAMHEHAPVPSVGRETLVRIVERWARTGQDDVTVIFDGPTPRGGMTAQLASPRIDVQYSAPKSADDIIITQVKRAKYPSQVRVVSTDTAIQYEARLRRCRATDCVSFIQELYPPQSKKGGDSAKKPEAGENLSQDADEWLNYFGIDKIDEEPFDGYDAMK